MQLIFVGNPKGGTGKSFFTASLVNHFADRDGRAMLIEADTTNPDTSRQFKDDAIVKVEKINLRDRSEWIKLSSEIEKYAQQENKKGSIVVNLPAGIDAVFNREIDTLAFNMRDLGIPLAMAWVADRGVDTVNLLKLAMPKLISNSVGLFFVKNTHWGDSAKFKIWADTKVVRPDFLKAGGREFEMPELDDTIALATWNAETPKRFSLAAVDLEYGQRMYLQAYIREAAKLFDSMFPPASKAAK